MVNDSFLRIGSIPKRDYYYCVTNSQTTTKPSIFKFLGNSRYIELHIQYLTISLTVIAFDIARENGC